MHRSSSNTRTKAAYLYLLLIHLFLAIVLWKSNFVEKIGIKLGISGPHLSFHERMVDYHKSMDGSVPEGSVLFIGDSITQALATSAVTNHSVNFGIGSDTTLGVIERLPLYKSVDSAKAVVLAIGINDIHQSMDRTSTLANYKKILDYIPSKVSVVATSVIPIGSNAESEGFTNKDIVSLNDAIDNLTAEYENVVYLDTSDKFGNDAGYLHDYLHIGDGVHLSDEGYAILIKSLKDILVVIDQP